MDKIQHQILKARRLWWTQSILSILSWCLIATFSICFCVLLAPKIWFIPYTLWNPGWMIGSAAVAALLTAVISVFYRPSFLSTAIELDKRFGLRERISSWVQLDVSERETPVGRALLEDAASKSERIDVRDQFPMRWAPHTPWVALPILSCVALLWVPDAELPAGTKLSGNNAQLMTNIKNQIKPIMEKIKKQREGLEKDGLQDAAEEFKKIERKLGDIEKSKSLDSKKLLSDFNALKKELEDRKKSLGSSDELKKSFDALKNIEKGPAEKIANSLKEGDFDKAGTELDKMLEKMKKGELGEEQRKQLAKQLDQMQKAVDKAMQEQEQAMEDAKKELEKAKNAGDLATAAKLQKKLEQMEANQKKAKAVEAVKANMKKAQEALEKGDQQAAEQALEELREELGDMASDQQAMEEMEDLMQNLQNAKNASSCSQCNGAGCNECKSGSKSDKQPQPNKNGKGEGRGAGEREETETDTKDYDAQVRDQMKKGETIFGGKVRGSNRKGVTKEAVQNAVLNAVPDNPDAIENMSLPKAQRDQQRDYFDALRNK